MKYNNTDSITSLVNQYLHNEGLESPLNEYRLMAAWPSIVGEKMSRYTYGMRIKNQTLLVQVHSPALRQELMMRREELVKALNQEIGAMVITDIVIR